MCFEKSAVISHLKSSSEKRGKNIKAVINIMQRLKSIGDVKGERYLADICNELKLNKIERWILTKLRMKLIQLEIESNDNHKKIPVNHTVQKQLGKATNSNPKKSMIVISQQDLDNIPEKEKKIFFNEFQRKNNSNSQRKTKRTSQKTLESRQLEKLRNKTFEEEKQCNNPTSKLGFLRNFSLDPQVIWQ